MKKVFTVLAAVSALAFCAQSAPLGYGEQVKMGAPQVNDEIIEEMPEGELSWLDRSCDGFNYKAFMATHSTILGSVVQRIDGEDGYVYLSHMASEYPVNTWTRFVKEGNTLVMEGVQAIYEEYDDYYEEYFTVYLAPMELKLNENNVGTFVVNDDCRYVLNVGEDGSLTSADPNLLLGVCVHTNNESLEGNDVWIWKGFGDRDIQMVPANGKPVNLPDGLDVQNWVMKDEYVNVFVQVAIDGNDFYICGLDQSLPDAWVKGTLADGKVSFPSGQYLGADMDIFYYSYFCGADFFDAVDEDGKPYRSCSYADSSVFAYDQEKGLLTSERGYIINSTPEQLYPLYFYEDVTVGLQHRNPEAAPEAPYDVEFFHDDWGSSIWFQIPNVDVEGNILMVDKLYYEIYVNGELQYFDITDADWNVIKTSRIPYVYDDWNDFWVAGSDHTVYIYEDDVTSVGVRSIYVNENGEDIYSEMAGWSDPDAVAEIDAGRIPVSVNWYDLQGRALNAKPSGFGIRVATYRDGSVETKKVMTSE